MTRSALSDSTNMALHGPTTRSQAAEKRKSTNQGVVFNEGYPSPAPSHPNSPIMATQPYFESPSAPLPRQSTSSQTAGMQGIEATILSSPTNANPRPAFTVPSIPPYNPNSKRRRQSTQEADGDAQPRQHARVDAPTPVQRPTTSSSGRSRDQAEMDAQIYQTSAQKAAAAALVTPEHLIPLRLAQSTSTKPPPERAPHPLGPAPHTVATTSSNAGIGLVQQQPAYQLSPQTSGRPRIFFGPYQLLQTLGEGEFGKVKLGVRGDQRWGEEVAIKLIKRGNVHDSQRMVKVVREIEVLRVVKHPNIVRLHDVIETEKYIGIVLEYASGGELFDHILAHRYLKDKDASKLFAQLISGVAYLHAKKIVHRDLKLENLLLDRNRNIIITDFGFANRFDSKGDDLMATSCGSPCYAAPELVVQDGKYVGSAVDVWSCGVIAYAMLAGYLPYDDDPHNPDSENINLLYKYILSTPLQFPEWITTGARDLLLRMLVPDPLKRCTLADVARHPWLSKYTSLFAKTVDQLEQMANEKDEAQRSALAKQRDLMTQADGQLAVNMTRSHSSTAAANRHQSAVVTSSSTMSHLYSPQTSRPSHTPRQEGSRRDERRAHAQSAIVIPSVSQPEVKTSPVLAVADTFSYERTASLETPVSAPMTLSASAPGRSLTPESSQEQEMPSKYVSTTTEEEAEQSRRRKAQAHRYTVQVEYDGGSAVDRDMPEPIAQPIVQPSPQSDQSFVQSSGNVSSQTVATRQSLMSNAILPPLSDGRPITPSTDQAEPTVPFPSPEREKVSLPGGVKSHVARTASNSSARPPSASSSRSRHNKPGSSDRFSISRLLSSTSSADKVNKSAQSDAPASPSSTQVQDEPVKRSNRRKALSLVVEPFKSSASNRSKRSSVRIQEAQAAQGDRVRANSTIITPHPAVPAATVFSPIKTSPRKAKAQVTRDDSLQREDPSWIANGPPANKAKRVMDWFRWRSLPRDSSFTNLKMAAEPAPASSASQFYPEPPTASTVPEPSVDTPVVVVTGAFSEPTAEIDVPSVVEEPVSAPLPTPETKSSNRSELQRDLSLSQSVREPSLNRATPFSDARLRFHSGAVDQNALTSKSPPLVLESIREALWSMGVDFAEESGPYRLKCVRASSKKVALLYGTTVAAVHSGKINASTASIAPANTSRIASPGLPSSPSSTFRSLFVRRGSSTSGAPAPSPGLSTNTASSETDQLFSPLSTTQSNLGNNKPLPFFGENDSGSEVRFTVEISRMRNLPNLYTIDVRRLRGNLFSYKSVYTQLIGTLDLA